ncbi:MAG: homoserine O-succinyltransferase [Firmicutes bacterium]|nr:homoserine O-succinyltransferase [Bacillota bacterium]
MPVIIDNELPAFKTLTAQNLSPIDKSTAEIPKKSRLKIAILILMPTKTQTETQLLKLLSTNSFFVEITLLKMQSHKSKNTPQEYLDKFYQNWADINDQAFDGLIITGAPVETMPFDQVLYISELRQILDWSKQNVKSNLFICWGAQVALNHFFKIEKVPLSSKMFGIFKQKKLIKSEPFLDGVKNNFFIPHSRHTGLDEAALKKHSELKILASGKKSKTSIVKSNDDKMFFLTGHSEYDLHTLDAEYKRDLNKGLKIKKPCNYYKKDTPIDSWSSAASQIFLNWLKFYVNNYPVS